LGRDYKVNRSGCKLEGKGAMVLKTVENLENLNFTELKSKLELFFWRGKPDTKLLFPLSTNRKQKFGKDLASFGAEIERLSRLAYSKYPFSVQDKIACAQFVSALSNNFMRRTLQLGGFTSLKLVIETVKVIKIIQRENFSNFNQIISKSRTVIVNRQDRETKPIRSKPGSWLAK